MSSSPLVNPFGNSSSVTPTNDGAIGKGKTADEIEDFLNLDDKLETEDDKPAKEAKEPKDDKDDEDDEIEVDDNEESKDEDIEKLDLKTKDDDEITVPPRKKEIEAEFPGIFKKFPFIEKMLFRDKEYTELFGSFDNAKEVASKVQELDRFEGELLSGRTETILKIVKDTDSKAFDKIVDDYLSALHRVDKDAYLEVCGNLGKNIIAGMVAEANKSDNEELKQAAQLLNQYLFATSDYTPPKLRVAKDDNDKTSEVEKERQQYLNERFEDSQKDLQSRVDNTLKSTIAEYIDPKNSMSDYERKNAINEVLELVHSSIGKDTAFRKNLDLLWKNAFVEKFSKISLDKIRSSYLGKSKTVLPESIKRVRGSVLKDKIKKEETEEKDETPSRERKVQTHAGRPPQQKVKANERQKGETVQDFFMRD